MWPSTMSDVQGAPEWTYIASAIGTLGLLVVAAAAALFALLQVNEARHARWAETMTDVSRRWVSDEMITSRAAVNAASDCDGGLMKRVADLDDGRNRDYYVLMREPDFFEDLSILEQTDAIDLGTIVQSLGVSIPLRWEIWQNVIHGLQRKWNDRTIYQEFEKLAIAVNQYRRALMPAISREPDRSQE